jgi:hypothetical protein
VYSALDCSSMFWQLELRPSDRPVTAFTIPGKGQYHWKMCPQGLMGAPASFSRMMDVLLADAENVLAYIDDVLVHSRSHEEHLKHLSAAIDKIGGGQLAAKPEEMCVRFGLGGVLGTNAVRGQGQTRAGRGEGDADGAAAEEREGVTLVLRASELFPIVYSPVHD